MTQLLTRSAVAKKMCVSIKTLDRLAKKRKIPVVRIGGVRFKESDVEKFISERTIKTA